MLLILKQGIKHFKLIAGRRRERGSYHQTHASRAIQGNPVLVGFHVGCRPFHLYTSSRYVHMLLQMSVRILIERSNSDESADGETVKNEDNET